MNRTLIALGANVADPNGGVRLGWSVVVSELGLSDARLSAVIETAPAEMARGPRFANAVGVGYTTAAPPVVLATLHRIEAAFGRNRTNEGHHGNRPLDLDLLAMGPLIIEDETLTLPHPRILQRSFVLEPLLELVPDWVHPKTCQSGSDALAHLLASQREQR
ncbi:MAG: 2-amino-4-hydroxy-6-hydroxymethyldihydropteridine diphosphokinase [Myxococcales bacterium]|nr:2-amino-4-hydroxy-6-hydroxymethyldihydropteridine diphosphokinase [Myxococcales bacterium]